MSVTKIWQNRNDLNYVIKTSKDDPDWITSTSDLEEAKQAVRRLLNHGYNESYIAVTDKDRKVIDEIYDFD